jgi:hypothetical protein
MRRVERIGRMGSVFAVAGWLGVVRVVFRFGRHAT